jgi:DNA-binding MarR family transcriptional regulator
MYNTHMREIKTVSPQTPLDTASNDLFRLIRFFGKRPFNAHTTQGIELSHIWVSQAVAAASQQAKLATVGWVATYSNIDSSTASRLVNGTLKVGFIRRMAVQSDGRAIALELTDTGHSLVQNVENYQQNIFVEATKGWSKSERMAFAQLFTRFVQSLLQKHSNSKI